MTAIEKDIQALKKDIQSLKHSVTRTGKAAIAEQASKVSFLHPEHLRSMAYQTGKEVSAYMMDKTERVKDMVNQCEGTIKKHPFITTAGALAAGALLAAIFRRK